MNIAGYDSDITDDSDSFCRSDSWSKLYEKKDGENKKDQIENNIMDSQLLDKQINETIQEKINKIFGNIQTMIENKQVNTQKESNIINENKELIFETNSLTSTSTSIQKQLDFINETNSLTSTSTTSIHKHHDFIHKNKKSITEKNLLTPTKLNFVIENKNNKIIFENKKKAKFISETKESNDLNNIMIENKESITETNSLSSKKTNFVNENKKKSKIYI